MLWQCCGPHRPPILHRRRRSLCNLKSIRGKRQKMKIQFEKLRTNCRQVIRRTFPIDEVLWNRTIACNGPWLRVRTWWNPIGWIYDQIYIDKLSKWMRPFIFCALGACAYKWDMNCCSIFHCRRRRRSYNTFVSCHKPIGQYIFAFLLYVSCTTVKTKQEKRATTTNAISLSLSPLRFLMRHRLTFCHSVFGTTSF